MAGDVKIGISVDATAANTGLQSIGKNLDSVASSVQGTTNDLRKGLDGVEQSAKKASKALPKVSTTSAKAGAQAGDASKKTDKLSDSLDSNASSAGEAASIMGGFAGALSVVSPRAGAAASALGALTSGLEAAYKSASKAAGASLNLTAILGPIGVAIAAGAIAWHKFNKELEEAERRMGAAAEKAARLAAIAGRVKPTQAERALKLAVLQGRADVKELEAFKAKQVAAGEYKDFKKEAHTELMASIQALSAVEAEQAAHRKTMAEDLSMTDVLLGRKGEDVFFPTAGALTAKADLERLTPQVERLTAARDKNKASLGALVVREREEAATILLINKLEKEASAAAKKRAEDDSNANKSGGRRARIETDRLKRLLEMKTAVQALEAAQRTAFVEGLDGEEQLNEKFKDRADVLRQVAGEHVSNSAVAQALADAEHQTELLRVQEVRDLREEDRASALSAVEEERQKRSDAHDQRMAEDLAHRQAIAGGLRDLTGNTAQLFDALSQSVSGMDRDMAKRLFNVSKAFTVSQIGLSTAEGLMTAAALPPPVDAIKAAAVIAQAGASLAIVAAQKPSFHAGTGMVRSPGQRRELNARLRAGEAVSTPLGAEIIGRGNIERANAGIGGSGGGSPVVFQYEHRVFSRFIRDNARMRGPLSSEINRGKNTGHRG